MNQCIVKLKDKTSVLVFADYAKIKEDKIQFFTETLTPVGTSALQAVRVGLTASFGEYDSFYIGQVLPGPFDGDVVVSYE